MVVRRDIVVVVVARRCVRVLRIAGCTVRADLVVVLELTHRRVSQRRLGMGLGPTLALI